MPVAVLAAVALAVTASGCGNDEGRQSSAGYAQTTQTVPPRDVSHLQAVLLDDWPGLQELSERALQAADLVHFDLPEGTSAGGYERTFADEGTELAVVLAELPEGSDAESLLGSLVTAWTGNASLIASEETDVPGMPEARGVRFQTGLDWVRLFAMEGLVVVDVAVRNRSSDVDALEVAAEVLEAQLNLLHQS